MLLHELSSGGSNQEEEVQSRLPPPALPLLTKHDRYSLAHEIERHIEFFVENEDGDRPVALSGGFVDHFMAYRDSQLPKVGAIVTAPLVLSDGSLLAPNGLDRQRKLVFQIEPALLPLLPDPAKCTARAAANALDYLCGKWLCDVATDFAGKCVLIALAMTILERALLPERPAFFVTAGQRGGGKTTAMMMVVLAVTGKKPPAAAWSSSEEERRKSIFAYLGEGLAAMVWDNIPRGTTISCPTIEKVLTAESYSDRVLGQTATITVPSLTVMAFTGNNIGPKGDLASRSLQTRLEVDRIDPENRTFTHGDPVAWTLEHRGRILRALYTIMLANPQSKPDLKVPSKTRFKGWWNLVGSAVESAAANLVEQQRDTIGQYATPIDFNSLFSAAESEDEEGATLAEVLEIIDRGWPRGGTFKAADLAKFITEPMQGEETDAQTLKEAFQAAGNSTSGSVTAKSIGRRLTVWAGTPILVGDETLMIERRGAQDQQKQKNALSFRIRRP
ncbi:MAG: hypothetical protein ACRYG8_05130 [Janthinobacterium lividum]